MQSSVIQNVKIQGGDPTPAPAAIQGQELEQLVGTSLLEDLNQQLADISNKMERELSDKQSLRQEMETIYSIKQNKEVIEAEGKQYVDLTPNETSLLNLEDSAIPSIDDSGEVISYRISKDSFDAAAEGGLHLREETLDQMNSNSELTMLKIQGLVDQRKNLLNLISNLMASTHSTAQAIIQNIRG